MRRPRRSPRSVWPPDGIALFCACIRSERGSIFALGGIVSDLQWTSLVEQLDSVTHLFPPSQASVTVPRRLLRADDGFSSPHAGVTHPVPRRPRNRSKFAPRCMRIPIWNQSARLCHSQTESSGSVLGYTAPTLGGDHLTGPALLRQLGSAACQHPSDLSKEQVSSFRRGMHHTTRHDVIDCITAVNIHDYILIPERKDETVGTVEEPTPGL